MQFKVRWKDFPDEKDKTWASFNDLHINNTVNTVFQEWLQKKINSTADPTQWKKLVR